MIFSHRNGETEPPTEIGWYWCGGALTVDGTRRKIWNMLYLADWHNESFVVGLPDGQMAVLGKDATGFREVTFSCQWWGPVTPPWEQDESR